MLKKLLCLILSMFISSPVLAERILVVSDLDDTLKITGIHDADMISNYLNGVEPFPELVAAFNELNRAKDADFVYLSNAPKILGSARWLKKHNLPEGELFDRTMGQVIGTHGYDFKLSVLRDVLEKRSANYDRIYLFGDNGEHDPEIYVRVVDEMRLGDKAKIFIRDVMVEATAFYNGQVTYGIDGVNYFLTEFRLFKHSDFDFISDELREVARRKDAAMDLPPFMLERIRELR